MECKGKKKRPYGQIRMVFFMFFDKFHDDLAQSDDERNAQS